MKQLPSGKEARSCSSVRHSGTLMCFGSSTCVAVILGETAVGRCNQYSPASIADNAAAPHAHRASCLNRCRARNAPTAFALPAVFVACQFSSCKIASSRTFSFSESGFIFMAQSLQQLFFEFKPEPGEPRLDGFVSLV